MRTIKFRGYNKKNSAWLYGSYILNRGAHFVAPDEFADGKTWEDYEVDPATVGQFTGLHDRNGIKIYEGDILLYNGNRRTVEWNYGTFGLSMHENGFPFQAFYELPVPIVDSTVVDNIHDDKNLLEKGGKK